jgi:hypothetical protein
MMFVGRLFGWLLVGLAVIMASADAVMALSPAEYAGIATADVVTLLAGHTPDVGASWSFLDAAENALLELPAWVAVGSLGVFCSFVFRHRPKTRRFAYRRG